jgi:hypothetical protein
MTYDRLVCANCAAPVNEGRCPVCRANRERLQQESPFAGLNPMALIADRRQAAAPRLFLRRGSMRKPIPPAIIVAAPTSRKVVSAAPVSASSPPPPVP